MQSIACNASMVKSDPQIIKKKQYPQFVYTALHECKKITQKWIGRDINNIIKLRDFYLLSYSIIGHQYLYFFCQTLIDSASKKQYYIVIVVEIDELNICNSINTTLKEFDIQSDISTNKAIQQSLIEEGLNYYKNIKNGMLEISRRQAASMNTSIEDLDQ